MWNIVIGVVFIIGGLSGKLALIGTGSGTALADRGRGAGRVGHLPGFPPQKLTAG
jgi:hypothetical protein